MKRIAVLSAALAPATGLTQAQVIRERNQAIAHSDLQPGAEYLNVVGAPTTNTVVGASYSVPAGQ